jgi:CheY-like chemotaxis protein
VKESRIIIVEDNAGDVLFVREALKHHGITFSLEHYMNGDDALQAMDRMREAPDLILLDINLPRVNGFELLTMVRNHPVLAKVPVAIVTSSVAPGDKTTAEQLGANSYIVKPSDYVEFLKEVGGEFARLLQGEAGHSGPRRNLHGLGDCSHRS